MRYPNSSAKKLTHCSAYPRKVCAARLVCAFALSILLAAGSFTSFYTDEAWADVRRSDVIAGSTIEERGISAGLCPSIDASYAIVVDDSGEVYFERDVLTPTQIASITKVMTAIVALDIASEHDLLQLNVTVSARAASIGESSAELAEGDIITVESALKALMIPSGNDAAMVLAENLGTYLVDTSEGAAGGGTDEQAAPDEAASDETAPDEAENGETTADGESVGEYTVVDADNDLALNAFVSAMNDKAAELGCSDTLFENPHGLDTDAHAGNLHSTAADVAKIAACAMQYDLFRDIVSMKQADITVQRGDQAIVITLENTDELLGVYDGACGIKTGYTSLAGSCFAGACNRNGNYLYAIVLDSTTDEQRFVDVQTLFDWVYNNYVDYTLGQSDETISMVVDGQRRVVPVVAEVAHNDWIDKTVKATFADPDASVNVFALKGNVSQSFEFYEVSGDVKAGDVIGSATFYQDDEVIAQQDVIAAEDVDAPGFFDSIGIWWSRFVGGIFGGVDEAQTVVLNDTPLIYNKKIG